MFGIGKKKSATRAYKPGTISVSDPEVRARIAFNQLTEDDLGVVSAWKPEGLAAIEPLLDRFYAHIANNAETMAIIDKHTSIERQRPRLAQYVTQFFSGTIDDAYVGVRKHVGGLHDKIDLDSSWYVAMYEVIKRTMIAAVEEAGGNEADVSQFRDAFERILQVDMGLVVTAMTESRAATVAELAAKNDFMDELVEEIAEVGEAATGGDLSRRIDVERFEGSARRATDQLNGMMDAMVLPIQECAEVLGQVAEGNLTVSVDGDYRGEHARIKDAINTSVGQLRDSLSQVKAASGEVSMAADQISVGSQALAEGTSQQAGTLGEISTNLKQITAKAEETTSNARQAQGLVEAAQKETEDGSERMARLTDAMEKIKTSSEETAKIVKTIDEIAFQTNLLALNAAVEAARAGDAGKGFAVVAGEVRNLAMRAAEAAKTTSQLIQEAGKNAEGGMTLNQEVLVSLQSISEQVEQVRGVMLEVSSAAESQTTAIRQVDEAVEQVNEVTLSTAASAEESSSTAEELSGQAEEMRSLVSRFKLDDGVRSTSPGMTKPTAQRDPTAAAFADDDFSSF